MLSHNWDALFANHTISTTAWLDHSGILGSALKGLTLTTAPISRPLSNIEFNPLITPLPRRKIWGNPGALWH
jgi:hypothetical protein